MDRTYTAADMREAFVDGAAMQRLHSHSAAEKICGACPQP